MSKSLDSITLDIVKNGLLAISTEVFYAFARTSMSPIIYETLDYASGITDKDGNLLTQGNGACGFIGMISPMIKECIAKHGLENIHAGDVFIINDPYMGGGTHLSDIGMIMPIFYQETLIGFVGNKAHWTDIGGMSPGSFTTDSTEVYQEGLCFSALKLVNKGKLSETLHDMLRSNTRFPDVSTGDMWGQIASLRTGDRRVGELCQKYGLDTVQNAMVRLIDQGEKIARKRLKEIPNGTWEMEDFMDNDGQGNPVKIKVKITITDDEFIADFRGSSPQVISPINTGYSSLCCGVKVAYMSIINPSMEINDGVFKPMRVISDEGSVTNCKRPAPTSCYYECMLYATDVVWKALAPVFPKHLGAGHMLSVCAVVLWGTHHDSQEPFLLIEPTGGGWGASKGKDGEVGQFCVGDGETYNVPVEMAETRYGIMVEEYSLHTDGKGAGEYRGGSGCIRTYKAMTDGQLFTASFGRNKLPAWGADGGQDGSYNYFKFITAEGEELAPEAIIARKVMNTGDKVVLYTCTGGGYGDALKRDPEKVACDVKNGYISKDQAENDYGIIISENFSIQKINR